jgi:sulfur-oxidizing protein SoxX
MKLFAQVAFAAALIGSASLAGSIAPSDVAFGSDGEVTASLTGVSGDAVSGRKLFMNRKKRKLLGLPC